MNISKFSSFTAYELTPQEERAAFTYNDAQLAGIQNTLSAAAEELIKIPLGEDDMTIQAIKRRSYLQGQIEVLRYLLVTHDTFNSPVKTPEEGDKE